MYLIYMQKCNHTAFFPSLLVHSPWVESVGLFCVFLKYFFLSVYFITYYFYFFAFKCVLSSHFIYGLLRNVVMSLPYRAWWPDPQQNSTIPTVIPETPIASGNAEMMRTTIPYNTSPYPWGSTVPHGDVVFDRIWPIVKTYFDKSVEMQAEQMQLAVQLGRCTSQMSTKQQANTTKTLIDKMTAISKRQDENVVELQHILQQALRYFMKPSASNIMKNVVQPQPQTQPHTMYPSLTQSAPLIPMPSNHTHINTAAASFPNANNSATTHSPSLSMHVSKIPNSVQSSPGKSVPLTMGMARSKAPTTEKTDKNEGNSDGIINASSAIETSPQLPLPTATNDTTLSSNSNSITIMAVTSTSGTSPSHLSTTTNSNAYSTNNNRCELCKTKPHTYALPNESQNVRWYKQCVSHGAQFAKPLRCDVCHIMTPSFAMPGEHIPKWCGMCKPIGAVDPNCSQPMESVAEALQQSASIRSVPKPIQSPQSAVSSVPVSSPAKHNVKSPSSNVHSPWQPRPKIQGKDTAMPMTRSIYQSALTCVLFCSSFPIYFCCFVLLLLMSVFTYDIAPRKLHWAPLDPLYLICLRQN